MADAKLLIEEVPTDRLKSILENNNYEQEIIDIAGNYLRNQKYKKNKVAYKQHQNIGRFYPKDNGYITLTLMPHKLRNYLCDGIYYDLDIVNCLPVICEQLCDRNNIQCSLLNDYNDGREEYLNEIIENCNCDRTTAKELINRIMNGGGIESWIEDNEIDTDECEIPNDIILLKQELTNIYKELYNKYHDKYKVVLEDYTGTNPVASLVARVLQDYENKILQLSYSYLKEQEYNIGAFIYDGMLVKQTKELTENVLRQLEQYIYSNLDLNIKWAIKPMDDMIDIIEDEDISEYQFNEDKLGCLDASYCALKIKAKTANGTYQLRKKYMELFIARTDVPEPLYWVQDHDAQLFQSYKKREFAEIMEHIPSGKLNQAGRPTTFTEEWFKDVNKRMYKTYSWVPFNPTNDKHKHLLKDDELNIFVGYNNHINHKYKASKEQICAKWLGVVLELCEGNEEYRHWYLCYLAQLIQDPSHRPHVAIGFKGPQGIGKNAHLEAIGIVLGPNKNTHFISSEKMETFVGSHAEGLNKKVLVNMDEAEGQDTSKYMSAIKFMVTAEHTDVNAKFRSPVQVPTFNRIIFSMNKHGLNFDGDSQDRRFTLFECNEKNKYITKKIKDGWKKLTDYWASPTHISALFDYLNEYNIDLQIAEQRPISELYKTLICKNRSPFIYFMESFICKCEWREFEKYNNKTYMDTEHIIKEDDEYYNKTIEIKQNEFKNHINQWLDQEGYGVYKNAPMKLLAKFLELQLPIAITDSKGGYKYFIFNPKQVWDVMETKGFINKDVINENELTEEWSIDDLPE